MITDNKDLMKLVENARLTNSKILTSQIEKIIPFDSDEFDEFISYLNENNLIDKYYDDLIENEDDEVRLIDQTIDLDELHNDTIDDDDNDSFLSNIENDPEFLEFSKEIENDLIKSKDFDENIVNSGSTFTDDPVKMYLNDIGSIPLLKPNEELELSKTIQLGIAASSILDEHKKGLKNLSSSDIEKYTKLAHEGKDAEDAFTLANLRLVFSVAKKFTNRGMEFMDLIQEGNMGLMKAVRKFDPNLGYRFSTYATWWIKQAMIRLIANQSRTIRLPNHVVDTINRMSKIQKRLTQQLHRDPTTKEIADEMKVSVDVITRLQTIALEPISIDMPVSDDDESTYGDFISDSNNLNPLDYTIREKFKEDFDDFIHSTLTPKEEDIFRLKFGLDDGKTKTLEEIGQMYGLTRERIRQIIRTAVRKMNAPARRRILMYIKDNIES